MASIQEIGVQNHVIKRIKGVLNPFPLVPGIFINVFLTWLLDEDASLE